MGGGFWSRGLSLQWTWWSTNMASLLEGARGHKRFFLRTYVLPDSASDSPGLYTAETVVVHFFGGGEDADAGHTIFPMCLIRPQSSLEEEAVFTYEYDMD